MVLKRKFAATISLSLLSLLVISVVPIYFVGATAAQDEFVEAGDVLLYSVSEFYFDFTRFNEEMDNPFEIDDHEILQNSVLYCKILYADFHEVQFAIGFVLGKASEVYLDRRDFDWGPDIDPSHLPSSVLLPKGAAVPIYAGYSDLDYPFPDYWGGPGEHLPLILNPEDDWEVLREDLVANWEPTSAEVVDDTLEASWSHAIGAAEEGIESGTLVWDKNEGGILTQASIKGQQIIDGDASPINIKITFENKVTTRRVPEGIDDRYIAEYDLSEVYVDLKGYEDLAGPQEREIIETMIARINGLQGTTAFQIEILAMEGLFYEFEITLLPDDPDFREGPEWGEAVGFGLGIPFLTPDWSFYTGVMATGDVVLDAFMSIFEAVTPGQIPTDQLDITNLMLEFKGAIEEGFYYFGFEFDEQVSVMEPEQGVTIYTDSDGTGWLAYEEDGKFSGLYFTMRGSVDTEGVPLEQGGDVHLDFRVTIKIERESPDSVDIPDPTLVSAEEMLKDPDDILAEAEEEVIPPGFIPGFELITAVAALLGLSVIVVRKRRRV